MWFRGLVCALMLAGAAGGDGGESGGGAGEPTAVIEGPERAALGDLVVLDASRSEANAFAWLLVGGPKSFLPVDQGRRCVFAAGTAGQYTFVLAVAGNDRVALARHLVTIGPAPPPPVPPAPPTPPAPEPLPHGKYDLARLARDWARLSVPLDGSRRDASARSLAASFHSMASAISAGTLTLPAEILAETKRSNQAALGADIGAWRPWFALLAAKLEALNQSGVLKLADDYATAWREIAGGLAEVKP